MVLAYRESCLDLSHHLQDLLLFLKNVVNELFGREMFEIGGSVGVFAVEIAAFKDPSGLYSSKSLAGIFQARSFSSRLFHHARQPANSSNWIGWVLV